MRFSLCLSVTCNSYIMSNWTLKNQEGGRRNRVRIALSDRKLRGQQRGYFPTGWWEERSPSIVTQPVSALSGHVHCKSCPSERYFFGGLVWRRLRTTPLHQCWPYSVVTSGLVIAYHDQTMSHCVSRPSVTACNDHESFIAYHYQTMSHCVSRPSVIRVTTMSHCVSRPWVTACHDHESLRVTTMSHCASRPWVNSCHVPGASAGNYTDMRSRITLYDLICFCRPLSPYVHAGSTLDPRILTSCDSKQFPRS
jgi:hypothetical protein